MKQFQITVCSFDQIQAFVRLAMEQPFDVLVGNDRQCINGKDIMGMFSLDYRFPLYVSVNCSDIEFDTFRQSAVRLLTV